MDNAFGALIWLVIIVIWIFSALKRTKRRGSGEAERKPSEFEKKILEALGIPAPEIPEPPIQETIEPEEKIDYAKKEEKAAFAGARAPLPEAPKPTEDKKLITGEAETGFSGLLTEKKLQEGIVLSVILGPPKAYQLSGFYTFAARKPCPSGQG